MEALKKNKILISVFLVTLIIFVYFFFFTGGSSSDTVVSTTGTEPTSSVGQDIINTLAQMNTIRIDTALFSGAVWMSLHDNSTPLPNETPGKNDLFAPVGQSGTTSVPPVTDNQTAQ